ncbi:hypothetical protein ACW7BJ_21640 [Azospirillum argentinense]
MQEGSGRSGNRRQAGGAATGGGMNFQAATTAIACIYMVRERPLLWLDTLVDDTPIAIDAETGGAGDDIRLLLKDKRTVETQVKKGLRSGNELWETLLKLATAVIKGSADFGVLVVSPSSSNTITSDLANDIVRIGDGRTDNLSDIAATFLSKLTTAGINARDACGRLRIQTVSALAANQAGVLAARAELAHVCAEEAQIGAAWNAVYTDAARMIEQRGRRDAAAVLRLLTTAGIRFAAATDAVHEEGERIARASADALAAIEDTLRHGEVQLSLVRPESWCRAIEVLGTEGIVRLTGDGGTGKSGVLKRLALSFDGPRFVIKDNRVTAATLAQHLAQLGVRTAPAALLDGLAGDGPALCVIDGADRLLMSERRGVVLDLFRALAMSSTTKQWRIVTSARAYQDRDLVADALTEAGLEQSGWAITIEGLTEADGETLARAFPAFAGLLRRGDLGGQNRSLFLLRELFGRSVPPTGAWTELDIADAWAVGVLGEPGRAARRCKALAQIGGALVAAPWRLPGRADIDPEGLQALLDEGSVLQLPNRDALRLTHDVHEDWLLARELHARADNLPGVLVNADQPLWWLRAVRLSAQIRLDEGDLQGWRALLNRLDAREGIDPAWARAVLAAPLYSERAAEILGALEPILLADDARLLRRLLDTLIVFETRLDEHLLAHLADQDETLRYTMAAYWKQPKFRSWVPFLRWSIPLWQSWPPGLIPRLSEIAGIFTRATAKRPNGLSQSLAPVLHDWLVEVENARHTTSWNDRREPFGIEFKEYRVWEQVEERLREALVNTVASAPATVSAYVVRLTKEKGLREPRTKLIGSPGTVPTRLPREWTDLCLRQFVPPRRRRPRDEMFGTQLFAYHDIMETGIRDEPGFFPASALRAGFDQLFEADAGSALRLFHRLERRASTFWRWFSKCTDRKHPRPLIIDLGHRQVTLWGDDPVYRWSRGILGSAVLGSAYLALDDWLERQAAAGRPIGELIELVLQDHGLVSTAPPLIAVLGEQMNTLGTIDHAAPFLAVPRLWSYDVARHVDDLGGAHRIGFFSPDDIHFRSRERNHQRHVKRGPMHHALLLPFQLMANAEAHARFGAARTAWTQADLANFEEDLNDPGRTAERAAQIERYRSDGDPEQIVFEEADQGIKVSIAPPAAALDNVEAWNTANRVLGEANVLADWVRATREQRAPDPAVALEDAIERATRLATALNDPENPNLSLAQRVGGAAIVGVAAVAAQHLDADTLAPRREWIEQWLELAVGAGDREDIDEGAVLFDDFQVIGAWGLAGLASRLPADPRLDAMIGALAVHRLDGVAQAVLEGLHWSQRPEFVRALHIAALDMCVVEVGWWWRGPKHRLRAQRRNARARLRAAARALREPPVRAPLVPPVPDSWQWVWTGKWPWPLRRLCMPAKRMLNWERALALVEQIDWSRLAETPRYRALFSTYLVQLVAWTRDYSEGTDRHDRQFPYKWGHGLAKAIGRFALAQGGGSEWRALLAFTYHDRAEDLLGEYLEGIVNGLVESGAAPGPGFWAAWQPAADWMIEHAVPCRHDSFDRLSRGVEAAGLIGPYMTPLPPDWPHLEAVLGAIDRWVRATVHLPSAASGVLAIVERMDTNQRAHWFLAWLLLWTNQHGPNESFWSYHGLGNKAAALLKPLANGGDEVRTRGRLVLAILADAGSTVARELMAAFATTRRG